MEKQGQVEEWFVSSIQATPLPVEHLLATLGTMAAEDVDKAEVWADRLQLVLSERLDGATTLRLLKLRITWGGDAQKTRAKVKTILDDVFRERKAIAESVGIEKGVPLAECLRRLESLLQWKDGTYCWEKTWKFGLVRRVDEFYRKVTVDFDAKPGHTMSLAYAAEAIHLAGPEHFYSRLHDDKPGIQAMAKDAPSDLVRLIVKSFGLITVADLKDYVVPGVMTESEWKKFWDAARKKLKEDPLVDIPVKRTDPIRIAEPKADATGGEWLEALRTERYTEEIFRRLDKRDRDTGTKNLDDAARAVIGERLDYIVRAGEGSKHELVCRAALAIHHWGAGNQDRALSLLMNLDALLHTIQNAPARDTRALLDLLLTRDAAATTTLLLTTIPELRSEQLTMVASALKAHGLDAQFGAALRTTLRNSTLNLEALHFACKHFEWMVAWSVAVDEIVMQVVNTLETYATEKSRIRNHLKYLFDDEKWIQEALGMMTHERRLALFLRMDSLKAWDEMSRRSVLAVIIKAYPEMTQVMETRHEGEAVSETTVRMTSWRSYRQRQEDLRVLAEKTIPENSKEIAHARSYGDLRENFEYQTAKDRQRLLMQRQSELEADLKTVQATDFKSVRTDIAGIGTSVRIQRPNGSEQTYHLLGEWDVEESLNIISCKSRVAEVLTGHNAGDEVVLPGDDKASSRILEVSPLMDVVKTWLDQTAVSV
jgi:transcription elongation GreA/GreB family factor